MKPEILVVIPPQPSVLPQLETAFVLHRMDEAADKEALLTEVGPRVRGVFTSGANRVDAALLDRLPKVEIVALTSVGYDRVDLAELTRRSIALTNTPDVLTDDVADTALLLMLAARRRLLAGDAWVRSGDWARKGAMPLASAAAGKRVGIVGLGRIGGAIATRCAALGMEIGYHGRSPKDVPYAYFDSVTGLADWCDVLIAATTGGAETRHLVSAEALAALGPAGCFVNIARGSVVDEDALIAALAEGRLGSAGLDVFASEPDCDPRFAALANVTLYPHHASGTVETRNAMSQLTADNLLAHFAGHPLLTRVV